MLELKDIIIAIVGMVGGGGLSFIVAMKKNRRDDVQQIVDILKADNERLREEMKEMRTRMEKMEEMHTLEIEKLREEHHEEKEKVVKLHAKLLLLETANHSSPFPTWLKDSNGVMLLLNEAYEAAFLKPNGMRASDYIHRTDYQVWPKHVADSYAIGDDFARKNKGKYFKGEEVILVDGDDVSDQWRIVKYGRFVNNVCVGIVGMAIPI